MSRHRLGYARKGLRRREMAKEVDARGLSCPQPVILARKAISEGDFPIRISVDTATARENLERLARKMGLQVEVVDAGGEFWLTLAK